MPHTPRSDRPVALVTGASSGIGRATARALADAGFAVAGTSRNAENAVPTDGVTFFDLDVTRDDSVDAVVSEVLQRFGRIDVLVNNAGAGTAGAAEENSISQTRAAFETNVFGTIRMTTAVLPHMRAQGAGRIINVSSVLGFIPAPFMAVYAATKHAVEGYSESVDHEVREHGVRVLLVEPGYTSTGFEDNTVWSDSPLPAYADQRAVIRDVISTAMRKADDPAVVAKVIVTAATAARPRVRYPAGSMASRVSVLRRLVPWRAFDRQIRKLNRLAD
ncbi:MULTISPECIES: oxidoreductase [unclassified Nocardioides]|uniref:oxidoreductase n=1 Tax=unclassified Nocardioides TaxID=2615069 RepID=UPI0006FC0428|nr:MULTISPECIES: oxidoreductase [unclassified Nocardioides]KRA28043.1 oxidoreductase [Nocardioides sp. Root614]KRA86018.1 oxidoreductase [Nocardioides sp. Root682]